MHPHLHRAGRPAAPPPVRSGDYFLSKSRRAYVLRSMGRLDAAP
ncbi:hypothetical protein ACFQ0M_10960 [Kitasatospora aburaviensis]